MLKIVLKPARDLAGILCVLKNVLTPKLQAIFGGFKNPSVA